MLSICCHASMVSPRYRFSCPSTSYQQRAHHQSDVRPSPFFSTKSTPPCLFHGLQHQNQHDQNENVMTNNATILGFFCPTTFVSYARRPCRHNPSVSRNRGTSGMYITSLQVVAGKQLLRRQSWYFCTSKSSKLSTCVGPRETSRRHHHCPTEVATPLPP